MKMLVKTKVIKRNGEEVGFDLGKIENAIRAANEEVDNIYKLNEFQVRAIADDIAGQVKKSTHAICRRHSGYGRDWNYGNAWL